MSGTLVWKGGFGSGVTLGAPEDLDDEWVQYLSGAESGGDDWGDVPNRPPEAARFSYLVPPTEVVIGDLGDFVNTELVTVLDHLGASKRVLHMELRDYNVPGPGGSARNQFGLYPPTAASQSYIKYWIKLQSDLATVLPSGTTHSVIILEAKEHGVPRADFRWNLSVQRLPSQAELLWRAVAEYGDLDDSPQAWELLNNTVPVPVGAWALVEMFWKSHPTAGRFYFAVNGEVVFNYTGQTQVNDYIQVWWPFKLYVGSQALFGGGNKLECWIEGMELWTDFPELPPAEGVVGGILLPINGGHVGIVRDRVVAPFGLYGDPRLQFRPTQPPVGICDLRDEVPFNGSFQIGVDAVGNATVNLNRSHSITPTSFSVGSALLKSPSEGKSGAWGGVYHGAAPAAPALPTGDSPYVSYINAKYDGTIIGASFQSDVLRLLEWTITPPTYSGTSIATPAQATAVVIATLAVVPADKPGQYWHEIDEGGPVIYFTGVLTGNLYRWDGVDLTIDGVVGAGADVITEEGGDLIIAGTNFIKRRTGAGTYVDIMPTGGLVPPALTSIGGLGFHASGVPGGGSYGGIDTGTHVFTPLCFADTSAGLFIAGSVWSTALGKVSHSIVFKVTATECFVVAVRAATYSGGETTLFGITGIGESTYPFDDASLAAQSADTIAGTTTAFLQTAIYAPGALFTSQLAVGDQLAINPAGGQGVVLSIVDDTHCTVASPIGHGGAQTLVRIRQNPISAPGAKVFFLDAGADPRTSFSYSYPGGGGVNLGMFDPATDRWYWNRMIACSQFTAGVSLTILKNNWYVGGLFLLGGELIFTTKALHNGVEYPAIWHVSMTKHFPVDANNTGFQLDYIYAPPGDQPPLYNAGFYQWWVPLGANLASQAGPVRGGKDRFFEIAGFFGRDFVLLNDDGAVA